MAKGSGKGTSGQTGTSTAAGVTTTGGASAAIAQEQALAQRAAAGDSVARAQLPAATRRSIQADRRQERRYEQAPQGTGAYDYDQTNKYGANLYRAWQGTIKKGEEAAFRTYKSSSSYINIPLRKGEELTGTAKTHAAALDKALLRARAPKDIVSYRIFGSKELFAQLKANNNNLDGKIFQDDGFVSSALKKGAFGGNFKNFQFKILIPKGSQGAFIGNLYSHHSETEFLLPRGTKFRIIKTKYSPGGTQMVVKAYTPNHPLYKDLGDVIK